jgi:hypothetical protein
MTAEIAHDLEQLLIMMDNFEIIVTSVFADIGKMEEQKFS